MSRGFKPETYIASLLAGASEDDVQAFYESLRDLRSSNAADLQANVFNNYASFVSLSHEISSLASDLSSLSTLLTQFSTLTQSLSSSVQKDIDTHTDQPAGYHRERRGAQHHRNSIADLAQIHATHLQELWHMVEGSQKYLPAHPGRHVIKESLNWTELNAATWKPTKTVHLILLNDHLLIAARKRGKASAEVRKSIADRCWSLADIEINELSEEAGESGAIQVLRGREVAVYAAGEGRKSERTTFIQAFKRAAIDLHNRRKQSEGHTIAKGNSLHLACPPRLTIIIGGQSSALLSTTNGHLKGNDAFLRRVSMNFNIDRKAGNADTSIRWVQEQMDDLDVRIAQRDFEEAVRSIEKG